MSATSTRAALVTGAGVRIGRAIALGLARHGLAVGVHYRSSRAAAEAVVGEIRAAGGRAAPVAGDLAEAGAAAAIIAAAERALGPLSCLINNASEFNPDGIGDLAAAGFDRHAAVNLRAPLLLAQAFVRQLPEAGPADIVNIVDQRVLRPTPAFFTYTLSKAGLWAATQMLAQALAPRVRVNAVGPGPVLASAHQSPAEFAAEAAATPLGRGASPEEIAAAVRFILDAPAMTGQMIALDGGQHLAPPITER
jgi:NAD(P)-dependent dehydrogenase (short-subunit alcohol dehydrogenase family)